MQQSISCEEQRGIKGETGKEKERTKNLVTTGKETETLETFSIQFSLSPCCLTCNDLFWRGVCAALLYGIQGHSSNKYRNVIWDEEQEGGKLPTLHSRDAHSQFAWVFHWHG